MIKGVIFDMDGVMIDSERQSNEGWLWAAKEKGVEMPIWLIDSFKGAPTSLSKQYFDDYYKGKMDYWEMRQLRTDYVYRLRETEGIPVKPGLSYILEYIRSKGLKCSVATSTRRESAFKTLHTIGAWDYLNAVVFGDEVERGKPEPDIFLKAAADMGVAPSECIVIEDSINGIKAGYAAGMKVVHVPDTIIIGEDIKALTAVVCDSLSEVPAVIDGWNTAFVIEKVQVEDTFAKYVADYDVKDDKVKLKIEHTYRVAALCQEIATGLKLSEADVDLAWLLGMFHDIGRFEQLRQYGTFNDAVSVDHAALSADILFKDGKVAEYISSEMLADGELLKLMEIAVRNHNAYRIAEDLSDREAMFCNILRDADKIDILKVCIEEPVEAVYAVTEEELYTSDVSPEVMEAFLQGHCVLKSIRKTAVDKLVGHISLVFELVYDVSRTVAVRQGYLNKLLSFNSKSEKTREQFKVIVQKMRSEGF